MNHKSSFDGIVYVQEVDHITQYSKVFFSLLQRSFPKPRTRIAHRGNESRWTVVQARHSDEDDRINLEIVNNASGHFHDAYLIALICGREDEAPETYDVTYALIHFKIVRTDFEELLILSHSIRYSGYGRNSVKFHWNISKIVETNATRIEKEQNLVEAYIPSFDALATF